jgi:hypothetical protein
MEAGEEVTKKKFEIRNTKFETNLKHEIGNSKPYATNLLDFRPRTCFGFRIFQVGTP